MSINFTKLENKIHDSDDTSSDSADVGSKNSEEKFLSIPDPDLPKPLSESEKIEEEMLKTMLELYRDNFKNLKFEHTDGLTLQELRTLKSRLDSQIAIGPTIDAYEQTFWMAMKTIEKMAIKANYDLSGWAHACSTDLNIVMDVRYIIINYVGRLRIRPELRLAMNMLKKAYLINTINESQKEKLVQSSTQNTQQDITKTFSEVKPVENIIKDSPVPPNISLEINKQ